MEKPAERYDLGLCLSGGGYRAMLFHAGALCRLNDAGLLPKLDMVSSVSGGSISAGLLAVVWADLAFDASGVASNFRAVYLDRILAVAQAFIDVPCAVKGILNPFSTAAAEISAAYEERLFDSRRPMLKSLPRRPWFVFCASNLSTGSLFRMSSRYVADYRIGVAYGADLPVATVLAASSAFPPVLSPLRLDLRAFQWTTDKLDDAIGQAVAPGRAVLTDGGVYDNHGLEPALKRCRWLLVSDGGAPWRVSSSGFWTWFGQLKRILDTEDNQVRALRRRDLMARFKAGEESCDPAGDAGEAGGGRAGVRGAYWSIAANPARYPADPSFSFVRTASKPPAEIGTNLHFLGERETEDIVNWGYYVSDIALRSHYRPRPAKAAAPPLATGSIIASREARRSKALMDRLGF